MSQHTASTPPTASPTHDGHDTSFTSSQGSPPDMSASSFESSFRLRIPMPDQKPDCEKHPKGKRKRTTTQDKTFLESAYNSNPKPDKAARLEIVKRVSLNEKEVQIWFQNRRQNDRRKSRPLSPQELAQFTLGHGIRVISGDLVNTPVDAISTPMAVPSAAKLPPALPTDAMGAADSEDSLTFRRTSSHDVSLSLSGSPLSSPAAVVETAKELGTEETGDGAGELLHATSPIATSSVDNSSVLSRATGVSTGYLANRWNIPPPIESSEDSLCPSSFSSSISSSSENVSHNISLSILLDGKAEVVTAQPSPPRPVSHLSSTFDTKLPSLALDNHNPARTLQRSQSALPAITLPPISDLLPPQLTRGRSRDVHAWKSVCDADRRDELTRQAENESSGSAIAAISLVRSSSSSASLSNLIHNHQSSQPRSSTSLQPNPAGRTQRNAGHFDSTKAQLQQQLPSLSSQVPLSSENRHDVYVSFEADHPEEDDFAESGSKKRQKQDPAGGFVTILSPLGDSDKENWSPGKEGGNPRRRPVPGGASPQLSGTTYSSTQQNPRRTGRILGEQDENSPRRHFDRPSKGALNRAITAPSALSNTRSRKQPGNSSDVFVFEDGEGSADKRRAGKGLDQAVERFMRGGEISPSKRPDLDCVEGLLSLSQGNWR
ncbi:hypothetical protein F5Y16DRAFT_355737 [Xylariaceae sp. FL0255]|nr:hypothetical protein F5Y16DRAFT_355737 [Xylariaceae sp. FL0255]